jgi:hypothetical protein
VQNPQRWARTKELFAAALEHQPEEREAFLRQACAGDEELRHEVESLLAASANTDILSVSPIPTHLRPKMTSADAGGSDAFALSHSGKTRRRRHGRGL